MLMPDGMRGKKRLHNMLLDTATRYVYAQRLFADSPRSALYHPEYFAHLRDRDPCERQIREFYTVPQLDSMAQMQYVDVRAYLADDILVKVDKASMFNSLETRAPLLDQRLAEYVASLPSAIRTRGGVLKHLLKQVAADILPAATLTRAKHGFGIPIEHWFRKELLSYAYDLLDSPRAHQRGIFNPDFIRHLLKTHASTKPVDYSQGIWALLCLELWFQTYMDEPVAAVEPRARISVTGH